MRKSFWGLFIALVIIVLTSQNAAAARVNFYATGVAGLDCLLSIRGWFDTETGHGEISWSGPCGNGRRSFRTTPDTPVNSVSDIAEAETKYEFISSGDEGGSDEAALAAFNAVAEDPAW